MTVAELRARLIGRWALTKFVFVTEDGETREPFGPAPKGRLIYLDDGIMSAHLGAGARSAIAGEAEGRAARAMAAYRAHFSYSGRFRVLEDEVLHEVDHAMSPDWEGTTVARRISFDGAALVLTDEAMALGERRGVGRLTWIRETPD